MTIAVYARPAVGHHTALMDLICSQLAAEKVQVMVYEPFYESLRQQGFQTAINTFNTSEALIAAADYVICLGGDGTMLDAVSFVRKSGIPVLGVNTGRLGFLASVSKEYLKKALDLLVHEKFTLDKRELITVNGCENCFDAINYGLNEFTIHKMDRSPMIHIDTYVDGVFLNSYFADGLIVATATGSTAYSLSCGGPIMMPDSDNFIITPIAPHNLTVRPLIISNNREISFSVRGRATEFNISLDSRIARIPVSQTISVQKADFRINLINLEGQQFFSTLRNKMMWGLDMRK
jgi:NAD+ kinase